MAKKTPKPPEFLTIYLLDDPELKSLVISLNRPITEALGAIFLLWALAVEAEAHQNEWILGMSWQEIDELIDLAAQERPSTLEVPQQTVGFVLGEHTNAPHTRVHAV